MRVSITVTGIQTQEDGGSEKIEISTTGSYKVYGNHFALGYEETDDGSRTTVLLGELVPKKSSPAKAGGTLQVIKEGAVRTRMTFSTGEVTDTGYETPYGVIPIILYTRSVKAWAEKAGCRIILSYTISYGGSEPVQCRILVKAEAT